MRRPKFLVITGDGINCERETASVVEFAGGETRICHINDLLEQVKWIHDFQGLIFPGGFSFGDELGSGQVLALKLRHGLADELKRFIEGPKSILGICNGFQVLVKLGVLPFRSLEKSSVALARNTHQTFIDRWVDLEVNKENDSPWLRELGQFVPMPIRHGEGRLVIPEDDPSIGEMIKEQKLWAFRYLEDINGSYERIAGLTDSTGRILGLMPHPEAASFAPQQGLELSSLKTLPSFKLFTSIVNSLKQE